MQQTKSRQSLVIETSAAARRDDAARALADLPAGFAGGFGWYVAYTRIKCEQHARKGLLAKRFAVYLPTYMREIRHARRAEIVERPLFPRYLFVGFDINRDQWTEVRRTDGVERLLSHDEIPVRVPTDVVEAIREAAQLSSHLRKIPGPPPPKIGEHVKIGDGPFRDFVVQVVSAPDERHRVEILMNVLGGARRVKMALAALQRASQK
jgi:transcriptional antiterminator RfaH